MIQRKKSVWRPRSVDEKKAEASKRRPKAESSSPGERAFLTLNEAEAYRSHGIIADAREVERFEEERRPVKEERFEKEKRPMKNESFVKEERSKKEEHSKKET